MRIAVAGGTGVVGAHMVRALREHGHEPLLLARSGNVDLLAGDDGLDAALAGAHAVIDVTNTTAQRERVAVAFFATVTERLLAAETRAGIGHHLVLSIVGIEGIDAGYYAGKRRQEELVEAGPVPATILRATQFHEFLAEIVRRTTRGRFGLVPRLRSQPIAAREAATALVDAALAPPAGRLPELAGPQVEDTPALGRLMLRGRGYRPLVAGLLPPGASGRAMAGGALLPRGEGPRGRETFAEWLTGEDAGPWR